MTNQVEMHGTIRDAYVCVMHAMWLLRGATVACMASLGGTTHEEKSRGRSIHKTSKSRGKPLFIPHMHKKIQSLNV